MTALTTVYGAHSRAAGNVTLTPAYPDGIAEDDILILAVFHSSNSTQASATYTIPGDFATNVIDDNANTNARIFVRYAIATGAETGPISITVSGGTSAAGHTSEIFSISGSLTSSFTEGGSADAGSGSTTMLDAGVTTTAANRTAFNIMGVSGNFTLSEFTGETGGDWLLDWDSATSEAPRMCVQKADMPTAGTINGGTFTISSNAVRMTVGFAVIHASVGGQPTIKRFGAIPSSRRLGVW